MTRNPRLAPIESLCAADLGRTSPASPTSPTSPNEGIMVADSAPDTSNPPDDQDVRIVLGARPEVMGALAERVLPGVV